MNRDLPWQKSRDCADNTCVEVAITEDGVFLRNSAAPDVIARFAHAEWQVFLNALQQGEFRAD